MATRYDYGSKLNDYEVNQQYAHSWHGDYGVTPTSVQMAPPESEWSEQSPSTHAFGSPAWSQKAELLGRDHMGSAANRPPLSLLSNRPLSMDAGTRWQQPPLQYQQSHQQQQPYQPDSPLLGANSAHQYARLMRSPTHSMQRRLSSLNAPAGGGSARDSNDGSRSDEHAVKAEPQREMVGAGFGLGLMDQNQAGHDSASLGSAATPCSNGDMAIVRPRSISNHRRPVPTVPLPHLHTTKAWAVPTGKSSATPRGAKETSLRWRTCSSHSIADRR